MHARMLSRVQLSATPWTVAHQAPLSMGFPRQEYWTGLPFPLPEDLSDPGTEPVFCHLLHWQAMAEDRFSSWVTWEAQRTSSSVAQSHPTLCNPMRCSMPGLPVFHHLPEFAQTHVHWVGDIIQPSHPLPSPPPPACNHSHHQSLFQWVYSTYQVAEVLDLKLQHQPFKWIFRIDFL